MHIQIRPVMAAVPPPHPPWHYHALFSTSLTIIFVTPTTGRLWLRSLFFHNFLFVQKKKQLFRLQGTSSKSVPKGSKTKELLAWNTPFFPHCQWQSVMQCHIMTCHVMTRHDKLSHVMSCHVTCPLMSCTTLRCTSNLSTVLKLGWNGCDMETLVK